MQGSTFKEQILTVMQHNTFFNSVMLPYNSTADGNALYTSFYQAVDREFPFYMDELRGMADGTNVSFSEVRIILHVQYQQETVTILIIVQLFLWNMMFEWSSLLNHEHLLTPSCSDLYISTQNRAVSGINEL